MALELFISRRSAREIDRARPEFEPLRRTLTEWKVGLDELQAAIDEIVRGVRSQIETAR